MKKVAIIDYGMGNLDSVARAIEECRGNPIITDRAEDLKEANYIILPGVGSFGDGMRNIRALGLEPILKKEVQELGAGEILLTSIDRDGTMEGYDMEMTREVAEAVSIPVIASGGAGSYEHMLEVLVKGKASAVAAASIYHSLK